MKHIIGESVVIVAVIVVLMVGMLIGAQRTGASPSTHHASVCYLTGLSGPALTENTEFCSTNTLTGVATNCCSSVYLQAIHAAQQDHLIVGTPMYLMQSVSWGGTPVTRVWFTSGLEAWHYDPSNGVATIENAYGQVLYTGR